MATAAVPATHVTLLSPSCGSLGAAAASVRLTNTSTEIANAIRHALMKDVCVAAVSSVTFVAYDGPLEAELIAHRFGQLPIALVDTDDASSLWRGGGGDAAADAGAIATLSVHVVNDGPALRWVTSRDIECTAGRVRIVHYRSAEEADTAAAARGHDVGFLVCPLHAGQTLHATAAVVVGSARTRDTRWCAVFVRMVPTSLLDDCVSDEADDAAPPTEYDFYIETTGAVTALGAWRQAVAALSAQLKRLAGGASVRALDTTRFH
jgi:hypothetical protein